MRVSEIWVPVRPDPPKILAHPQILVERVSCPQRPCDCNCSGKADHAHEAEQHDVEIIAWNLRRPTLPSRGAWAHTCSGYPPSDGNTEQYDDFEAMPATVRLNDIVDAQEMQFDESCSLLHRDTQRTPCISELVPNPQCLERALENPRFFLQVERPRPRQQKWR